MLCSLDTNMWKPKAIKFTNFLNHMLLRFVVRCIGKFSVYFLEIKIQITDIFDFYLLRQNQDLTRNCKNVIQE